MGKLFFLTFFAFSICNYEVFSSSFGFKNATGQYFTVNGKTYKILQKTEHTRKVEKCMECKIQPGIDQLPQPPAFPPPPGAPPNAAPGVPPPPSLGGNNPPSPQVLESILSFLSNPIVSCRKTC
uniref:Adhesive protein 4 n=1 Tax=Minona ileanae TaxID=60013 RepID=A0A5J6BTM3_9PLAT|nr:adhesive protein 4 [Minona ileanae]